MRKRRQPGLPLWTRFVAAHAIGVICLGCVAAARAQEGSDADALAKQLSNPVSALISVPLQSNWDTGLGADGDGERITLNVQPVIPIELNERWNVISRTIVPLIHQSDVRGDDDQSGIGDVTQSLFFSPKQPTATGWIWGAGPVLLLPSASDDLLGAEQWGLGPTAVVLKQTASGWTYGALVNHVWSVAGDEDRTDVNASFMQPFLSKALPQARTVTANLEAVYDWENRQWNTPLNLSYSKVTIIGGQRLSASAGARMYLDAPHGGADWGLRVAVTLLFPM